MTTKLDRRVQEHLRHVRQLVRQLDVEPPEDGGDLSWIAFARDVLDERHGIEVDSRDASAPELDDETLALLVEADELLSTQLFRLLTLNAHRQKRLAAIPTDERADFWWYSRGASLPAEAVHHLSDVAALLAAFPEARREFDALSRAEDLLISTPSRARVSAPSWGKHAPLWTSGDEAASPSSSSLPGSFAGSRSDAPRSARWRTWSVVASAALVVLGVGGGLAFHSAQQRAEAEKAALEAQLADAEKAALDQVARLKSQTEDAGTMSQAQQDRLKAQIALAEKKAQEAARASEAAGASPASAGGAARPVRVRSGSASSSSSNCAPGDPMCGGQ